jgi:hypothetical protein
MRDTLIVIGSEVLTADIMKSSIFWDITACSGLEVYRCFGGTYSLNRQGRRISQVQSRWQADPYFTVVLLFGPDDWGDIFLRNNGLHAVKSQKIEMYVVIWPPDSPDLSPLDCSIFNEVSVQKLERIPVASGTTATKYLEYIVSHVTIQYLTRYQSKERTYLSRNINYLGVGGLFSRDSDDVNVTVLNEMQILYFWTLSIVLFLSKTPSCFK